MALRIIDIQKRYQTEIGQMKILKRIENYYYRFQTELTRRWWNHFSGTSPFLCDVLMFHHVTDGYVDAIPSCRRTRDEFRQTLQKRIDAGVKFISMDEVNKLVHHGGKGSYATVTFDDVPNNFLSDAYPILKELQIPFTLFLTTSYLETPGYINLCDLETLTSEPLCTIGAHTVSHPMLRKVKNSYEEIADSKKQLEDLIGSKVKYFAYPYGRPSSISNRVKRQARKAGFEIAFCTIFAPINKVSVRNRYYLPRVID